MTLTAWFGLATLTSWIETLTSWLGPGILTSWIFHGILTSARCGLQMAAPPSLSGFGCTFLEKKNLNGGNPRGYKSRLSLLISS